MANWPEVSGQEHTYTCAFSLTQTHPPQAQSRCRPPQVGVCFHKGMTSYSMSDQSWEPGYQTAILGFVLQTYRQAGIENRETARRTHHVFDFSHTQRWELGHPSPLPMAQTQGQKWSGARQAPVRQLLPAFKLIMVHSDFGHRLLKAIL